MSRDFSPRDHWIVNTQYPDLYFSNFEIISGNTKRLMFTEQELEDRKQFPHLAVCGADIYRKLREKLSEEKFSKLEEMLKDLISKDFKEQGTSEFPSWLTDWYFNKHKHYYHEPNDEELMDHILYQGVL